MRILPILFNEEMVRAILDGRKTVTRRIVKAPILRETEEPDDVSVENEMAMFRWKNKKTIGGFNIKAPFQSGNILYVRETWCNANKEGVEPEYYYYADIFMCEDYDRTEWKWRPSIHMPKEAARIWLKVTDVKVKHLQEITIEDVRAEGLSSMAVHAGDMEIALQEWKILWDSTIKKSDYDRYGWNANPWVWVIEFERCEKPEID